MRSGPASSRRPPRPARGRRRPGWRHRPARHYPWAPCCGPAGRGCDRPARVRRPAKIDAAGDGPLHERASAVAHSHRRPARCRQPSTRAERARSWATMIMALAPASIARPMMSSPARTSRTPIRAVPTSARVCAAERRRPTRPRWPPRARGSRRHSRARHRRVQRGFSAPSTIERRRPSTRQEEPTAGIAIGRVLPEPAVKRTGWKAAPRRRPSTGTTGGACDRHPRGRHRMEPDIQATDEVERRRGWGCRSSSSSVTSSP